MIKDINVDSGTSCPALHKTHCYVKPFRVLNLYACLGGNRLLWEDCEVTAVELDTELARMYQERFPNDTVIVADAHQYLLDHYKEFDFIRSSPPCPSHSLQRFSQAKVRNNYTVLFPDFKLYEEIVFLDYYYDGKWVVENVIPFYKPIIPGKEIGRHLFWSNFTIASIATKKLSVCSGKDEVNNLCKHHKIDLSSYKGEQRKDKIARNLVDYEVGRTIFNTARGIIEKSNVKQFDMFE